MITKITFFTSFIALTYFLFILFFDNNSILSYYQKQDQFKTISEKLVQVEKKNIGLDQHLAKTQSKITKDTLLELGYIAPDEIIVDLKIPEITKIDKPSPSNHLSLSTFIFVFFLFLFIILGLILKYRLNFSKHPPPEVPSP